MTEFNLFHELSDEEKRMGAQRRSRMEVKRLETVSELTKEGRRSAEVNRRLFILRNPSDSIFYWPNIFLQSECDEINRKVASLLRVDVIKWTDKRHSSYPTVDIPIAAMPDDLRNHIVLLINERVISRLCSSTGFSDGQLKLIDLFLVKYEVDGEGGQRSLDLHSDGSLLSFNILINDPSDFTGGGTYFEAIEKVFTPEKGHCIAHWGKLMHAGREITSGVRMILVGFVDTCTTNHKGRLQLNSFS
jgi:hypothetical protein